MNAMDAEAKFQGGEGGKEADTPTGARLRKTVAAPEAAPSDPDDKGAHRKTLSMSEEAKRAEDFINVRVVGGLVTACGVWCCCPGACCARVAERAHVSNAATTCQTPPPPCV